MAPFFTIFFQFCLKCKKVVFLNFSENHTIFCSKPSLYSWKKLLFPFCCGTLNNDLFGKICPNLVISGLIHRHFNFFNRKKVMLAKRIHSLPFLHTLWPPSPRIVLKCLKWRFFNLRIKFCVIIILVEIWLV